MSTQPNHANDLPQASPLRRFAGVTAVILAVIDIYAEALHQAGEVQKRYPRAIATSRAASRS